MSTRATYRFRDWGRDVTFYIHHDGYPAGAAEYFRAMLAREGSMQTYNHGLSEVFFRANDNAEFTTCHDDHGDTEYRYDVGNARTQYRFHEGAEQNRRLVAWERTGYDGWREFFTGSVEEFVSKYARA